MLTLTYYFPDYETLKPVSSYLEAVGITCSSSRFPYWSLTTSDSFVMDLIEEYCSLNDIHYSCEVYYD